MKKVLLLTALCAVWSVANAIIVTNTVATADSEAEVRVSKGFQ